MFSNRLDRSTEFERLRKYRSDYTTDAFSMGCFNLLFQSILSFWQSKTTHYHSSLIDTLNLLAENRGKRTGQKRFNFANCYWAVTHTYQEYILHVLLYIRLTMKNLIGREHSIN